MSENDKNQTNPAPEQETAPPKRRFRLDRRLLIASGASFAAGALSVLTLKKSKAKKDADEVLLIEDPEVTETFEA